MFLFSQNNRDSLVIASDLSTGNTSLAIVASLLIIVIAFFVYWKRRKRIKSDGIIQQNVNIGSSNLNGGSKNLAIIKDEAKIHTALVKDPPLFEPPKSIKKYIGYNPVNVFAQSEPLNFPYVLMPNPESVIMFPRIGRTGRKGYKEEDFKKHIDKYFRETHQIFDDRFILVKNNINPYEPDFTLIDEKNGLNLFLDIEIDEPYEGLNDIEKRKATHFQYSDTNRNNSFKSRGWIVIRFAEIQVHQQPISCCRFVADVIKSISPGLKVSETLINAKQITEVKQWTYDEALAWSKEKYREKYLGIDRFGLLPGEEREEDVVQTESEKQVEKDVKDEPIVITEITNPVKKDSATDLVFKTIGEKKFLSFGYNGTRTIVMPTKLNGNKLTAFCFVKNCQKEFDITSLKNLEKKSSYYSAKVSAPNVGVDAVKRAVKSAILYKKYVRMKYTRAAWSTMDVDIETGEILMTNVIAEESIRTIDNIQMATDALTEEHLKYYRIDENYINAYCHKREEKRTFKFDRIGEIEILDV